MPFGLDKVFETVSSGALYLLFVFVCFFIFAGLSPSENLSKLFFLLLYKNKKRGEYTVNEYLKLVPRKEQEWSDYLKWFFGIIIIAVVYAYGTFTDSLSIGQVESLNNMVIVPECFPIPNAAVVRSNVLLEEMRNAEIADEKIEASLASCGANLEFFQYARIHDRCRDMYQMYKEQPVYYAHTFYRSCHFINDLHQHIRNRAFLAEQVWPEVLVTIKDKERKKNYFTSLIRMEYYLIIVMFLAFVAVLAAKIIRRIALSRLLRTTRNYIRHLTEHVEHLSLVKIIFILVGFNFILYSTHMTYEMQEEDLAHLLYKKYFQDLRKPELKETGTETPATVGPQQIWYAPFLNAFERYAAGDDREIHSILNIPYRRSNTDIHLERMISAPQAPPMQ